MLELIRSRQTRYAANFARDNWHEDELSDIGWLCLVAVPWLLAQLDGNGNNQGNNRNGNSYPGTNSVGLPEASLKLMLPKNSVSDSSLVVITGNPIAKFFVCLIAKIVGVRFVCHMSSNVKLRGAPLLARPLERHVRQLRGQREDVAHPTGHPD